MAFAHSIISKQKGLPVLFVLFGLLRQLDLRSSQLIRTIIMRIVSMTFYFVKCKDVYKRQPLAFMRHATGKIRSGDSLMAIETLGFRGDALSSIAAVAQVEMVSRQKNAQIGSRILIHGGEVKAQGECGSPEGTSVTVDHLFYNTPARLKFAKSTQAETAQILSLIHI